MVRENTNRMTEDEKKKHNHGIYPDGGNCPAYSWERDGLGEPGVTDWKGMIIWVLGLIGIDLISETVSDVGTGVGDHIQSE